MEHYEVLVLLFTTADMVLVSSCIKYSQLKYKYKY